MAYSDIKDPSAYFQTTLYTGNNTGGASNTITNDGNSDLQPDWVWIKSRSGTANHNNSDSSRGATKRLAQNISYQEETVAGISAYNSNGFTVGSNNDANYNGASFVAWQWKANGGTTASNTDGTITSTVQANQDAGFSIVTYTGTGANATVGHGLGVIPDLVIYKNRTDGGASGATNGNWIVQSSQYAVDQFMTLNSTNAVATDTGYFRGVRPSSTVLTLGVYNSNNGSNDNLVAYAFASKQGYSKFGSYTGNGNVDGTFTYLGFKPAFLLIKAATTAGQNWLVQDSKRPAYNPTSGRLFANTSGAENTDTELPDFLSNGFKVRSTSYGTNKLNETYIYMAFAESPFVAGGVPTTAR